MKTVHVKKIDSTSVLRNVVKKRNPHLLLMECHLSQPLTSIMKSSPKSKNRLKRIQNIALRFQFLASAPKLIHTLI